MEGKQESNVANCTMKRIIKVVPLSFVVGINLGLNYYKLKSYKGIAIAIYSYGNLKG